MHTVEHVLGLLERSTFILPEEPVPLGESLARLLSRPVISDIDAPPFDRATRDGYALLAADARPEAPLQILGHQDAGVDANLHVRPGTCVAINTGAPIPPGADAVAMVMKAPVVNPLCSTKAVKRGRRNSST